MCENFNKEIQSVFMYASIHFSKHCFLHVVDTGTGYSETKIANQRSSESMASLLELIWTHRHGTPFSFSADNELTIGTMGKFLNCHVIPLNKRLVRRHDKAGISERRHQTIKIILEHLQNYKSPSSDLKLLSRVTVSSSRLYRSKVFEVI